MAGPPLLRAPTALPGVVGARGAGAKVQEKVGAGFWGSGYGESEVPTDTQGRCCWAGKWLSLAVDGRQGLETKPGAGCRDG